MILKLVCRLANTNIAAKFSRAFGFHGILSRLAAKSVADAIASVPDIAEAYSKNYRHEVSSERQNQDYFYQASRKLSTSVYKMNISYVRGIPESFSEYENRLLSSLRKPFSELQLGGLTLQIVVDCLKPSTVLDVGCGEGRHTAILTENGCKVTAVDYGRSLYFEKSKGDVEIIIGNFMEIDLSGKYDVVWMSHVLEHQLDVNAFLKKARDLVSPGGYLVVTVPPSKPEVVGGHLTLWTPGLLIYNLILAGFDCKDCKVIRYGYNISVICKPRSGSLPELSFDIGDVDKLSEYFPDGCSEGFNGEMYEYLWTPPGY